MSGLITFGLGESNASTVTTGFTALSAVGASNKVTVSFATDFPPSSLTGASADPTQWTISGPTTVTVTAVAIVGATVVLTTTNQTGGDTYTLNIPAGMMSGSNGFLGPFSLTFTGESTSPTIILAKAVDARLVDVFFDVPPTVLSEALNSNNYSITPTLTVSAVEQISSTWFRLTTSHQTLGTSYTVTFTP